MADRRGSAGEAIPDDAAAPATGAEAEGVVDENPPAAEDAGEDDAGAEAADYDGGAAGNSAEDTAGGAQDGSYDGAEGGNAVVDASAFEVYDDGNNDGADGGGGEDGTSGQPQEVFDPVAAAIDALPATLLQYGEPVVLDEAPDGSLVEAAPTASSPSAATGGASSSLATIGGGKSGSRQHHRPQNPGAHPLLPVFRQQGSVLSEAPVVTTTERLLHALLPPREYSVVIEAGPDGRPTKSKRIVQPVSDIQSSRQQLHELREVLDFKLRDAKARQTGTCPVRRAIFTMLFDELLRQTTIDCPERGLLLLRIRDQLRMTHDAQCVLYESSVQETRRRIFEATKSKPELMGRVAHLTDETETLRKEVRRLEAQHVALLRASEEQQQTDAKKHGEEVLFLERTKQRLLQHIERVKELYEEERRKMRGELV